jgi:hypothetical protein
MPNYKVARSSTSNGRVTARPTDSNEIYATAEVVAGDWELTFTAPSVGETFVSFITDAGDVKNEVVTPINITPPTFVGGNYTGQMVISAGDSAWSNIILPETSTGILTVKLTASSDYNFGEFVGFTFASANLLVGNQGQQFFGIIASDAYLQARSANGSFISSPTGVLIADPIKYLSINFDTKTTTAYDSTGLLLNSLVYTGDFDKGVALYGEVFGSTDGKTVEIEFRDFITPAGVPESTLFAYDTSIPFPLAP